MLGDSDRSRNLDQLEGSVSPAPARTRTLASSWPMTNDQSELLVLGRDHNLKE